MTKFTLTEMRTLNKLVEVARMLNSRANKIADALGSDVDSVSICGEEFDAVMDTVIVALSLDPSEWNEDLVYDLINQRVELDTFLKFVVKIGEDYRDRAYITGHGYFFEHEKPDLVETLGVIGGSKFE